VKNIIVCKVNITAFTTIASDKFINDFFFSAVLSMDIDRTPYIADGGLIGKYNFAQMHFHWGANNSVGSEHTLGGSR